MWLPSVGMAIGLTVLFVDLCQGQNYCGRTPSWYVESESPMSTYLGHVRVVALLEAS